MATSTDPLRSSGLVAEGGGETLTLITGTVGVGDALKDRPIAKPRPPPIIILVIRSVNTRLVFTSSLLLYQALTSAPIVAPSAVVNTSKECYSYPLTCFMFTYD